jgi:hypothetical protein
MNRSIAIGGLLTGALSIGCSGPRPTLAPTAVDAGASRALNEASGSVSKTVPFKGTLEGTSSITPLQPPLASVVVDATGNATHLGDFSIHIPHTVNFATASGVGTFTFTAANGDTVTGTFTGQAQPGPITSIEEHAIITGGTGRFAGASGSFTLNRLLNQATEITTGSFEGEISAPGAAKP